MSFKITLVFTFLTLVFSSCNANKHVIFNDVLGDKTKWVVEQQPEGNVIFGQNKIEIIDANGCTIWFKNKLKGNIKIEYDVIVIDSGGIYDRVSDNNCFCMAQDPKNPDSFFENSTLRQGKFSNYNSLKLYYVGYGGHGNTKTRFRKYDGNFERPLLPEHDLSDKKFLIVPNKKMHIEIINNKDLITYRCNSDLVFKINDPKPYTEGYFGFRTVNNHMIIENFKVIGLK